jgi:outer membrane protein assembly factor BamD (BamD/ComL family)
MTPSLLRFGLAALLCAASSWPATAQDRRWADLYLEGRDAVQAGRYQDGIRLLEQAVKLQPTQEREKQISRNERTEYFPYYYLGVAYLRTEQLEPADAAFRKSRECNCLTNQLSGLQEAWEGQLAKARLAAGTIDPALLARLKQLDAAQAAGRLNEAIGLLDQIRSLHTAEYMRRGLDKRRVEVERGLAAQLVQEGQQLLGAGEFAAARDRFLAAEKRSPGSGQAGLSEVRQRISAAYTRLRQSAEADQAAGRLESALEYLRQAEAVSPEQYAADGLAARAAEWRKALQDSMTAEKVGHLLERARAAAAANRYAEATGLYRSVADLQNNAEARAFVDAQARFVTFRDRARRHHRDGELDLARQALDEARQQHEARFKFEQLDALLAEIEAKLGTLPEEQIAPVRTALLAYLRGDARQARDLLEPIAAGGEALDPRVRVHVLAYLGVSYAELSLTSRDEAERAALRGRAVEYFRALLSLQPEYQLRESLVSPRVREILEEVRIRR